MRRYLPILLLAAAIVALPFALRPRGPRAQRPRRHAPPLFILTPHNEAIRVEFARAFERWHEEQYGEPVRVEWLAIGGTTEIARYLSAEYVSAARAWWRARGGAWPAGAGEALIAPRDPPPAAAGDAAAAARRAALCELRAAFRAADDPAQFTTGMDVFFGGGQYDHQRAVEQGMTVPPWPDGPPPGLLTDAAGGELIPVELSGEIWRAPTYFGNAVSAFGICYNPERLAAWGLPAPTQWRDLAAPGYFRRLGVADPTKSGSIAKAFEMIVQQECRRAVRAAGFDAAAVARYEEAYRAAGRAGDDAPPPGVPDAYPAAVADGWRAGINLLRRIGANARYFTDAAGKVPLDVASGQAAAGLAIDFYARFQADYSRAADGAPRLRFVTPRGGSSVSADPVSLLRGAPRRAQAVRFIEFVLRPEGQRLWTYRAGAPGGPKTYTLRRLPARRDFYPDPDRPDRQAAHREHARWAADDLSDPDINPYRLAEDFVYQPRWTGRHFGLLRDLVRAMCLDSLDELQAAWAAILSAGGPDANPAAMALLEQFPDRPEPLTWRSGLDYGARHERLDYLRAWTNFFRQAYRAARARAGAAPAEKSREETEP